MSLRYGLGTQLSASTLLLLLPGPHGPIAFCWVNPDGLDGPTSSNFLYIVSINLNTLAALAKGFHNRRWVGRVWTRVRPEEGPGWIIGSEEVPNLGVNPEAR